MVLPSVSPVILAGLLVIISGLLVGAGGTAALRRLPEPTPPPGSDPQTIAEYDSKINYASLPTRTFALITAGTAAAGMLIAVITQPAAYWPCWMIISTVGLLLAAIDARTTWLPIELTYAGWLAMIAAIGVTVIVGTPGPIGRALITIVGGAVICGGGYLLLWLISRGRGVAFGDVRLMPLVGAVAGTMGWSGIYWTVLLGSVVGGLVGLGRLILRRRGPFPYAPALVSGPYAAALLTMLTT